MLRDRQYDDPPQDVASPKLDRTWLLMLENSSLDLIDRRIIHALAVAPRAPFRLLAEAAGIADQTAARRYRRLQETIGLRVLGRVDGTRVGWDDWYLRIRCVPGGATAIAGGLARWPGTRWVVIGSGGTEVMCALQTRTAREHDELLLERLPGSRRVVDLSAHSLLRNYSPPAWGRLTQELSSADCERLHPVCPADDADSAGTFPLSARDETLLGHLARDGRATAASLATATGWNESTVRRRIDELRRAGVLYFDIDGDNAAFGMKAHAMLWATVEPSRLDATARAVSGHPEVPFAAAITGPANFMATVVCADTSQLRTYLTRQLASLPGIRSLETIPLIRVVKRSAADGRQ
jgi:DNA-binding Lrp family transcriptional regulator